MKAAKPRRERVLGPVEVVRMAGATVMGGERTGATDGLRHRARLVGSVVAQVALDRLDLAREPAVVTGPVVDLDDDADPGRDLGHLVDARLEQGHDLVP